MSEDILKVARRNKSKTNVAKILGFNDDRFSVVIKTENNGESYISLNISNHKDDDVKDSKPAVTYKGSSLIKSMEIFKSFKSMIDEYKDKQTTSNRYDNINSETISMFKKSAELKLDESNIIYQDESLSRKIERNSYSSNNGSRRFNFAEINSAVNSIQPAFLLEGLSLLGKIQKIGVIENGSDEEIYEYASMSTGQTYKTSVKSVKHLTTDDNLNHPDSNVYKHFRPFTNGGRSSFGLLRDLIADGLDVGVPNTLTGKDLNNKIREFIFQHIHPIVGSENLANSDIQSNFKNDGYITQKVNNYSRLPIIVENHQESNKFKSYFTGRGLSNNLVDKIIDSQDFYIGDFYKDNIKGDPSDVSIKDYHQKGFFKITDKYGRETGAEKLSLYNDGYNGNRPNVKIHKINTHIIQGNSFKFKSKSKDIKGTFIGEAALDSLSSYELISMAGENPDDYNYSSIQGINNLSGFLEHNFGIKYTADRRNKTYDYKYANVIKKQFKVTDDDIERVQSSFKSKLYFVNVISDPKSKMYLDKVEAFSKTYNIDVSVINVKNNTDEIFKPEGEAACYIDNSSFDLLMNSNGIHIRKDNTVTTLKTKIEYEDINNENILKIKSNIKNVFGSDKVMFVFDNDDAGQLDIQIVKELREKFSFNFIDMTPPKFFKFDKPDVNDILKEVNRLNNINKKVDSDALLNSFLKPIGLKKQPVNNIKLNM